MQGKPLCEARRPSHERRLCVQNSPRPNCVRWLNQFMNDGECRSFSSPSLEEELQCDANSRQLRAAYSHSHREFTSGRNRVYTLKCNRTFWICLCFIVTRISNSMCSGLPLTFVTICEPSSVQMLHAFHQRFDGSCNEHISRCTDASNPFRTKILRAVYICRDSMD
jgi:hypothetical protein